ncbi:MAG TPA: tetratricopeptide repeat protein [Micromonosporaceae bacterium]
MSDVAISPTDAVREARVQIDAGDLPAVLLKLRPILTSATLSLDDPDPDPDLAEAARLYAGVLTSLGESYSALPYSTYAHKAARALNDPSSPAALLADLVHAFVLRATMGMTEAVTLYRDVVARLATRCGPASRPALAAQADMAVTLHAAGECEEARTTLQSTCVAHKAAFGPADPQGIQMLARLGSLTLDCGEFEQAHQHFDEAKALCSKHLPAADPLIRNVTSAARAGTNPGHVCGKTATSQHGLQVSDLFVSALELKANDLVASTPEPEPEECDPFVSAFEALISGTTVSITSHLAPKNDRWSSGVIGQIVGSINIKGGEDYPFTIDAPEGPRDGLPDHVQIRIFAPGNGPDTPD